jgi:putative transposase
MKYNPQIHHRKSIRLKEYDYSQSGAHFITICCKGMQCFFGQIDDGEMQLNDNGQIAYNEWRKLPERFANMELDVFVIMPNHIHAIIVLKCYCCPGQRN